MNGCILTTELPAGREGCDYSTRVTSRTGVVCRVVLLPYNRPYLRAKSHWCQFQKRSVAGVGKFIARRLFVSARQKHVEKQKVSKLILVGTESHRDGEISVQADLGDCEGHPLARLIAWAVDSDRSRFLRQGFRSAPKAHSVWFLLSLVHFVSPFLSVSVSPNM